MRYSDFLSTGLRRSRLFAGICTSAAALFGSNLNKHGKKRQGFWSRESLKMPGALLDSGFPLFPRELFEGTLFEKSTGAQVLGVPLFREHGACHHRWSFNRWPRSLFVKTAKLSLDLWRQVLKQLWWALKPTGISVDLNAPLMSTAKGLGIELADVAAVGSTWGVAPEDGGDFSVQQSP